MGCGNELVRGQGEWRWYAGWGVLTRVGGGCRPDFVFDHSLLLICSSWSCTWFLGRRWGLLTPCALEMYSEASSVVTFPCGPRILAVREGSLCMVLCNLFGGFRNIFCMGLDARIYITNLSCRVDKPFFL